MSIRATLVILFFLALRPVAALAERGQVVGTVQGYSCVVLGIKCPTDKEDPVIAAEKIFVVYTPEGSYYMIPNIDRAILARHLIEKVRVSGDVDQKYRSIRARSLEVRKGDTWKLTWTKEMEDEMRRRLLLGK